MLKQIKQQFKSFDDASFIHALKLFIIASLFIVGYGFVFSGFQVVDEFEHLHASWLVSQGKLPYRDFFEHHHPLLWYLSSPIVLVFYDNAIVFYVMRLISLGCSCLTIFYIYKISQFFLNIKGGWLAISLSFCNIISLYNFYQFRPDNFMNLFFIMGIYFWFCYLDKKQLKTLILSFIYFGISFLFLQKIGLILSTVISILLRLTFTHKMKFKNIVIASIPCIILVVLCFAYFIINGAEIEFYALNYRFNQALVYYFDRGSFWLGNLFASIYGITFFIALYLFRKENLYFKIISILYCSEFLMRTFYFSPHPNYYTTLVFLNALVLSLFLTKHVGKYFISNILIIIVLFLYQGFLFNKIIQTSEKHNSYNNFKLASYVHQNSNKDDIIMNGYDKSFNIYRPDASYYWFGLDMLIPVMEQEFGLKKIIDVNDVIINKRPKFIYTKNHIDLRAFRMYGETKFSQVYEASLIKSLYKPTDFEHLVTLK